MIALAFLQEAAWIKAGKGRECASVHTLPVWTSVYPAGSSISFQPAQIEAACSFRNSSEKTFLKSLFLFRCSLESTECSILLCTTQHILNDTKQFVYIKGLTNHGDFLLTQSLQSFMDFFG